VLPCHPPLTAAARALAELSDKQLLALEALLQGKTRAEAARQAGCGERSLRRGQHDPVFRTALQQARCDLWLETTSLLQQGNREAVEALLAAVRDDEHKYARVLAARTVLDLTVKAVGLDAHGARLDEIERNIEIYVHRQQPGAPDPSTPGAPQGTHYGVPLDIDPAPITYTEDDEDDEDAPEEEADETNEAPDAAIHRGAATESRAAVHPVHPVHGAGRESRLALQPSGPQGRDYRPASPLARIEAFCRRFAPRRPICNLQSSLCTLQLPGVAGKRLA
jgi:hypothetical protein